MSSDYKNNIIKDIDYKINTYTYINTYKYNNKNEDMDIQGYGNILKATLAREIIRDLTKDQIDKLNTIISKLNQAGVNLSSRDILELITIVKNPAYRQMIDQIINQIAPTQANSAQPTAQSTTTQAKSNQTVIQDTTQTKPEEIKPTPEPTSDIKNRRNPVIDAFLSDIINKQKTANFRGWVLPNGELISQYNDNTNGYAIRQDHGRLVALFMNGLKQYNIDDYNKMQALYEQYQSAMTFGDIRESFAVDVLGWIQVSHNGRMRLVYRGERWQDELVRPFLIDYGFDYLISDNGKCHEDEFAHLYDHLGEIIELGLENKYEKPRAV